MTEQKQCKIYFFNIVMIFCLLPFALNGIQSQILQETLQSEKPPFNYDLAIEVVPNSQPNADVMICCHGMGSNNQIVDYLRSVPEITVHLIGFNFPDHDITCNAYNAARTTFGTIQEVLPVLYLLKQCVVKAGMDKISLYGFSAGGGAVINALAVLNQNRYPEELAKLAITEYDKRRILAAVQRGKIILEVPLKSIDEIVAQNRRDPFLETLRKRYTSNRMVPIESLSGLQGLSLQAFVYFNHPDEVLSNRDDALFIQKLRSFNTSGQTTAIIGSSQGHNSYHSELWKVYGKREPQL